MSAPTVPAADRSLPIAGTRAAWVAVARRLRQHPGKLVVIAISFALTAASGLVAPIALGRLVDLLAAADEPTMRPFVVAALAVVAAGLIGALATWIGWRALARVAESTVAELRESAVDRALAVDAAVIERAGTGDLVSRVAEDSRVVGDATAQLLPLLLNSLFTVVVTAAGMAVVDWRLGLVGLIALPMYWLSLHWYLPRSGPYYTAERAAFAVRASHLLGGITGAPTLRAYGAPQRELARIDASSARARDLAIDVFGLLTRFAGRNNRAEAVVLGLLLGVGFVFVLQDWVTPGAVATAALLFHRLFNPIGALVTLFDDVQSALASLRRMVGIAEAPVVPRSGSLPAAPWTLAGTGLGHSYQSGRPVLSGVDLRIAAGEVVALVGATGAGKTTLASIMAGVITAEHGTATLNGVDVRTVPEPDLRRAICLVSQEVHVFDGTLADDLTLGCPDADTEQVWAALRATRADSWAAALPDGLQTRVGAGGHRLTPVQAQQVALARVIIADPAFVVLDEATAEAGSAGSRDLDIAAAAAVDGRAGLVVAHRLSQARLADRILVLDSGAVVESGSHRDLVAAGGRYARLWDAWSAGAGPGAGDRG